MGGIASARQRPIDKLLEDARFLVYGLERISADSIWAHRSSGYRGSLLRLIDRYEAGQAMGQVDLAHLEALIQAGYDLLIRAAREIGRP